MKQGHTIKKKAKMMGCSSSFLNNKSKLVDLHIRGRLSALDDNQLQERVSTLQDQYPNSGNEVCLFYRKLIFKLDPLVRVFFNH
jgi:hypothetical protein